MSIKPGSNHCKWINYTQSSHSLLGVVKEKTAKFLEKVCLVIQNIRIIFNKETLEKIIKGMMEKMNKIKKLIRKETSIGVKLLNSNN